jgi:hypothetical protein
MCLSVRTVLRCDHDQPCQTAFKQCHNTTGANQGCQFEAYVAVRGDFKLRTKGPKPADKDGKNFEQVEVANDHVYMILDHHGGNLELSTVVKDRICWDCRAEDLKRPAQQQKWADVPLTNDASGRLYLWNSLPETSAQEVIPERPDVTRYELNSSD